MLDLREVDEKYMKVYMKIHAIKVDMKIWVGTCGLNICLHLTLYNLLFFGLYSI